MAAVMIGVDPHKGSHTAVVIDQAETVLGHVRVRACVAQAERLLAWAQAWPERTWAIEGAGGLGHLLITQPWRGALRRALLRGCPRDRHRRHQAPVGAGGGLDGERDAGHRAAGGFA